MTIYTGLGAVDDVTVQFPVPSDATVDHVQLSIGSYTASSGSWLTPDSVTITGGVCTAALLIGNGHLNPTAGRYWVWYRVVDAPRILIDAVRATPFVTTDIAGSPVVPVPPFVPSVFGRTGPITAQPGDYTAAQVGADAAGAAAAVSATSIPLAQKAAANGVASLDSSTKIPAGQVPPLDAAQITSGVLARARIPNISGSFWQTVANQAAMLALTAPDADTLLVVFRTDTPGYIWYLNPGLSPATLGNWVNVQEDAAGAAAAAQAAAAADATSKVAAQATTDAGTYAPRLVTGKTVGQGATVLREFTDPNDTASKWRELITTNNFQGKSDPNYFIGWNADRAASNGDTTEPALYMGFEANYWDTPTKATMEWYVAVLPAAGGTGAGMRPFAFTAARDSNNDSSASVQIDIGNNANGSARSVFNVVAGAPSVLSITPTTAEFAVPVSIDAPLQAGAITTNCTATVANGIYFSRDGATQSYYTIFHGDASHLYLWDPNNGRFQMSYTFGASNTAAKVEYQATVQIDGRFGCNGVTPPAQPARAVTLADVIAVLAGSGLTA